MCVCNPSTDWVETEESLGLADCQLSQKHKLQINGETLPQRNKAERYSISSFQKVLATYAATDSVSP